MPRHRLLLFTYGYREKGFRGRHWYVPGFAGEKRVQLWFRSEREAKAAADHRNAEIKAHGTQVSLSPKDRLEAIAAAERLAPYGKSITEAVAFYVTHLDRLASSISVRALCERVRGEFERRLAAKEISAPHALNMRETLRKFEGRFGDTPVKPSTAPRLKRGSLRCPSPRRPATGTWATCATSSGWRGNGTLSPRTPSNGWPGSTTRTGTPGK